MSKPLPRNRSAAFDASPFIPLPFKTEIVNTPWALVTEIFWVGLGTLVTLAFVGVTLVNEEVGSLDGSRVGSDTSSTTVSSIEKLSVGVICASSILDLLVKFLKIKKPPPRIKISTINNSIGLRLEDNKDLFSDGIVGIRMKVKLYRPLSTYI